MSPEITRLQNSLQHLRETQTILREHVATESPQEIDVEITKAIEENETVMYASSYRCDHPADRPNTDTVDLRRSE